MHRYERPVRFAEVDAARIVFFSRFLEYCHDALEDLFAGLEGGYPGLTMGRGLGIPTVHLTVDYRGPLRYGDTALVDVVVERVGNTSVTFLHRITRKSDGALCAELRHVVVLARLDAMAPTGLPEDVKALLARHLTISEVARSSRAGA
jgi:4-hydroxybenzoyl-CoA thioesterase